MKPAPVGTRIRVVSNHHGHSYAVGETYTIVAVDDDGTFKAADAEGDVGNWLNWEECEFAAPSLWDLLAPELPDDLVRFLSCFDGIQSLRLHRQVADAVLRNVPDLHERITNVAGTAEGGFVIGHNLPRPVEFRSET